MSGGGKGDKQESQIKLPPEIEALAKRNLQNAETAGKIGYVPYEGPTVAAFNPMQVNAMQQNADAMRAFGMRPANVAAAIPKATTYAGGVRGYDPLALYAQALAKVSPWQKQQIVAPTFQTPQPKDFAPTRTTAMGIPVPAKAAPRPSATAIRTTQEMLRKKKAAAVRRAITGK